MHAAHQEFPALDVLLVRHAEPVPVDTPKYEENARPLTDAGRAAALELAAELEPFQIDAIYSSPYSRAVQTVEPTARRRALEVQLLPDMRERLLSPTSMPAWRDHLDRSWTDPDYAVADGETGREAQRRGMAMLDLLRSRHAQGGRVLVASHGNLISLMLQSLEPGVDLDFHLAMPMPAIYRLRHDERGWRVIGGHGFVVAEDGG